MSGRLHKVDFVLDRHARGETIDEIAAAEKLPREQVEAIVECEDGEVDEGDEDFGG